VVTAVVTAAAGMAVEEIDKKSAAGKSMIEEFQYKGMRPKQYSARCMSRVTCHI
jgi:hypothetical protein